MLYTHLKIYYLSVLILAFLFKSVSCISSRPIIGILAQENFNRNGSYIPASYVKAVEASGARVIPILIGQPRTYYIRFVNDLNGIVFPGGSVNLHAKGGYGEAGKYIYEEAIFMAEHGKPVPILGVCQGLELLATLSNNGKDILTKCSGTSNVALNLRFLPGFSTNSLYRTAPRRDINALARHNITANHHELCLTRKNLTLFKLDKFWNVLTVSRDAKYQEFISSMEAADYPFVGVQFHPEKVAYEWNIEQKNPHSPTAVRANRLFYDWLIFQARLNQNTFNNTEVEKKLLIYNYTPRYTGKYDGYSEQVYYF